MCVCASPDYFDLFNQFRGHTHAHRCRLCKKIEAQELYFHMGRKVGSCSKLTYRMNVKPQMNADLESAKNISYYISAVGGKSLWVG